MMNALNVIRKFGLGYTDLPTLIWNVSVFLRVVTLNIDGRNKTREMFKYN